MRHRYFWRPSQGSAHGLPGPLVVALTSYPPRYPTLHLTLRSLLSQATAADRIVLCVTADDRARLPAAVTCLEGHGLTILLSAEDIRSYKKIIPPLEAYPNAFIVTADDDIYYEPQWLGALVSAYQPQTPAVICNRAHRAKFEESGRLAPYADWDWEVPGRTEGFDLFPTGVGGVLYPPGILPPETSDAATFMRHAPRADDVWLFFMGRRAGVRYRTTGFKTRGLDWLGSQTSSLNQTNVAEGGNDIQIRNLEEALGLAKLVLR